MANKFTNREKKYLIYAGIFFAVLVLLWAVFAPDRGILDMIQTRNKLEKLQAENKKLAEENTALRKKIDRLQDDPAYLEEKARKEYGLLKENEVLYIFNKDKK
jgi:cell division protein FtsB